MSLAPIDVILFLKDVVLFEGLGNPELVEVARLAEKIDLEAGRVLFRQGDPPDYLYLVRDGRLRVASGDTELAHLGPGECVGEMAVLGGTDRTATVETITSARLLRFAADDFLALLDAHPEIGRALLGSLVRRLAHAVGPSEGVPSTIHGLIESRRAG